LFQHHDSRNVDVLCYAAVALPDRITELIRREVPVWRSTLGAGDEALAEMIRQDRIDILVDLAQHTGGNRLPMFARKPAPVQVSFAGYPESTGVEAIEYRISDRWLEKGTMPNDECRMIETGAECIFLIESFWCYDPCGMEVAVNGLPAKA